MKIVLFVLTVLGFVHGAAEAAIIRIESAKAARRSKATIRVVFDPEGELLSSWTLAIAISDGVASGLQITEARSGPAISGEAGLFVLVEHGIDQLSGDLAVSQAAFFFPEPIRCGGSWIPPLASR